MGLPFAPSVPGPGRNVVVVVLAMLWQWDCLSVSLSSPRFAYDVYEGFQKKKQTLAVAVDLEDAYNRMQFKLLMELLVLHGVVL